MKDGIILFDVDYTTNHPSRNYPVRLLPRSMEMKFNQNFISYTLKDGVGLFNLSTISNLKERTTTVLIKVFDKKYVYTGPIEDGSIFFRRANPYTVISGKDTIRLSGILCQKARVTDTMSHRTFEVAYVEGVDIDNINEYTPYKDIDGLLMKFVVQMENLEILFTAKRYIEKEVPDQAFVIPDGYKFISKEQTIKIISSLLP
ncbi:MAG: hypothetical protein Q8928_03050 [Bacteroidota bacterium]|nr:hypothetical protein [Bacteroidota bacterium]